MTSTNLMNGNTLERKREGKKERKKERKEKKTGEKMSTINEHRSNNSRKKKMCQNMNRGFMPSFLRVRDWLGGKNNRKKKFILAYTIKD